VSTLRVAAVNNAAATTGGLSIDSSGVVTGGLPTPGRNLLYNGAMQVAQRGTSVTGINNGGYNTADRWLLSTEAAMFGTWTQTVENDAPTGSGLRKSLKVLCTTADASPAAGDYLLITQTLEGQDVQRIAKGTSSAQQLTLSFWVKSNVTGTYVCDVRDLDNTRVVSAAYSISASATWEKKTITFPADTTGALDNDNAGSLAAEFWLGAGSTYTAGTLSTVWSTSITTNRATGQTNLAAATNNYWQITGVQLEVGPTGTGFEFKSFGQELAECQRYYFRNTSSSAYAGFGPGIAYSTTRVDALVQHPTAMRIAPTGIDTSALAVSDSLTVTAVTSTTINQASQAATLLTANVASGLTQYRPYILSANNNVAAYVGLSAEL
jgi:hypothetical protein